MAKGVRKFTSFLWALLIAILSFFIIFIFFPDVSNRFFGVSVKGEDIRKAVEEVSGSVGDAVTQVVTETADTITEKIVTNGL